MPIGLCFVHSFSLYKVFKLHYFSLDFLFAGSLFVAVLLRRLSPVLLEDLREIALRRVVQIRRDRGERVVRMAEQIFSLVQLLPMDVIRDAHAEFFSEMQGQAAAAKSAMH